MADDRVLYGWRVRSELPLPNLAPWSGDDHAAPDVEITIAPLPEPAGPAAVDRAYWQVWADGTYRLSIPQIARYQAVLGRRVVIEPAAGADDNDIRVFLLGTLAGILCHQRGLFPLHASAVRMDGRAVMISGMSGAGKSSLAAALARRGHGLVADDVVAIQAPPAGETRVFPAFPLHKLTLDVMNQLAVPASGLLSNRPDQPKYLVPAQAPFDPTPLPPHVLYMLVRLPFEPSAISRPSTAEAIARIDAMTYRRGVGLALTPAGTLFKAAAALARTIPIHVLRVRDEDPLSTLDALAEKVEAHAQGLARR